MESEWITAITIVINKLILTQRPFLFQLSEFIKFIFSPLFRCNYLKKKVDRELNCENEHTSVVSSPNTLVLTDLSHPMSPAHSRSMSRSSCTACWSLSSSKVMSAFYNQAPSCGNNHQFCLEIRKLHKVILHFFV